jgi:hypothetical protein
MRRKSELYFEYDFSMIEGIDSSTQERKRVLGVESCILERCSREFDQCCFA